MITPSDLLDRPPHRVDESSCRALLRGRRVLITGAGGSIGSVIARQCDNSGVVFQTGIMDRSEPALYRTQGLIAGNCATLLADCADPDACAEVCRTFAPEIIFHAAAHKHVPMLESNRAEAFRNNVMGTVSMLDAAIASGCRHFVLVSTDKAVNPSSVMGTTKRLAELYLQHKAEVTPDLHWTIVRFGNVLASSGSVVETWMRQIERGGPITVTDRGMTRYFMTIPEAASLVIRAAALESGTYMLDMGDPVNIDAMARRLIEKTGSPCEIVYTGVRPGEKIAEELNYPHERLEATSAPGILRVTSTTQEIAA